MIPTLDRALLLGGGLAILCGVLVLRWGWNLLRALWRRMNVRGGVPYLKSSISSYAGLTLLALAGLALGGFVVFADLTLRRTGRVDGDVVDVGMLSVESAGGRLIVTLEPGPGVAFPAGEVALPGDRWRLTGSLVQFDGLWRLFGIPDGYRLESVEAASGPRGRPDEWKIERRPLVSADAWRDAWDRVSRPVPGIRVLPHATGWEEGGPMSVRLVVTPSGYAFVEEPGR